MCVTITHKLKKLSQDGMDFKATYNLHMFH